MYGGHITDNWDRRLCNAYLAAFVREELLDGLTFFPKFEAPPPNLSYKQYCEYVDEHLKVETPTAFGLHPNSEINFMTAQVRADRRSPTHLPPITSPRTGAPPIPPKAPHLQNRMTNPCPLATLPTQSRFLVRPTNSFLPRASCSRAEVSALAA